MKSDERAPRVVIVGGGITGLSAAWRLQQTSDIPLEISLLEASGRWGGKILTDTLTVDGVELEAEAGAESFVTRKPQVWDLAHELGLEGDIKVVQNEAGGTYLLHHGQLVPVPLSPAAFLRSPLMTFGGKLRLLMEPFVPRKRDDEDESLAEFARRRLGQQAADNLIAPILAGIYNADPERQSILTTSPIMRQMEREHGGLFLAALARALRPRGDRADRPRFISFKHGTKQLVEQLVEAINGQLQLNTAVESIQQDADGFRVVSASGEHLQAETVLLAAPANKSAHLVATMAPAAAASLRQIRHTNIGTLLLALPAKTARPQPGITGLMIPRREERLIDAITWLGKHSIDSAAKEIEILKLYFGGAAPHLMDHTAAGAIELLLAELSDLLAIQVKPLATRLHRWPDGYPQADVGHLDRIGDLETKLPPGLFIAGSSYRGLAVPDCILQANQTAAEIVRYLSSNNSRRDSA